MSRNEGGSKTKWICAWVPYVVYLREREREREREKHHYREYQKIENKRYVCMKCAWDCDVQKKTASWGQPNPILTAHKFSTYKHTSKCMKHYENANEMQCMIILHQKHNSQPKNFTKHSSIFKNPKNFKKPQNLGLNVWNAWRMSDRKIIPSDLRLD